MKDGLYVSITWETPKKCRIDIPYSSIGPGRLTDIVRIFAEKSFEKYPEMFL